MREGHGYCGTSVPVPSSGEESLLDERVPDPVEARVLKMARVSRDKGLNTMVNEGKR